MSYAIAKEKTASRKDLLAVVECAKIVEDWTNVTANIYYTDFELSNVHFENVIRVNKKSVALTKGSSTSPSAEEFYFDIPNKRLYINTSNPTSYTMVVFFELYLATRSIDSYIDPTDDTTTEVYFAPRISEGRISLPQNNRDDMQIFGTASGSISFINSDGSFYIYDGFKNKNIKLYHMVGSDQSVKNIYRGKIEEFDINDNEIKLSFRSLEHVFNSTFFSNGYGNEYSSYFNYTFWTPFDENFKGYARRHVYGVVDDIMGINLDFEEDALTTNNRRWFVKHDHNTQHQLSLTLAVGSTTTNLIVGADHFLKIGDSVFNSTKTTASFVTAVDTDNVDVSPAFAAVDTDDVIERSTIGYIKIKDDSGNFYNLKYGIDYTETAPAAGIGVLNFVGFILADNFEANHAGLTTFNPSGMQIFCRCYGKKHATTNDSSIGNLTDSSLILIDLFSNFAGLTTDDYNETDITALTDGRPLGFSIPEDLSPTFPTFREIIKKINNSVLGQIYIDDDNKISYRYLNPLEASSYTLDSSKILQGSFSVDFDGSQIYSLYKIFYSRKENSNGAQRYSHSYEYKTSDVALYLHEVNETLEIQVYLINDTDAEDIANRYMLLYEDWQRFISLESKLQLADNTVGETITIKREKMTGFNYVKRTFRSITAVISSMNKNLRGIKIKTNTQKNIEDNSGSW